jgi:ACS family D-galactonate transporter-like MFS transporter
MSLSENRKAWTAVVLVFLFMLINFADKAVIGLASVPIMRDLGLNHRQFGLLGSAFFLLFSLSGIVVGFLANRVRTKILMLGMGVIWSAALLPMSVAASFKMLLASRVVLGAAEGPAFPVAVHSVYKWFGDRRRALPTSVVASGAAFGTGLAAPVITWIIVHYGWHTAFGALGVIGLVWACLWLVFAEEGPIDAMAGVGADAASVGAASGPGGPGGPSASGGSGGPGASGFGASLRVPYRRLLLSRTALGVFVAGFAAYWIIALNIVWLANYLIKAAHMSATEAGWVITLPSIMQMALAPLCAYLSLALTRRGYSSRTSRGVLGSACVIVAGVTLASVPFAGSGVLEIALVGLSCSIGSVIFTLGTTLIGEISPASQRGAMLGITNSIHTLAGLCAPFLMGLLVDIDANPIAGFRTGYLYAGTLVAILGALAAVLIDPEADLLHFDRNRIP